MCDDRDEAVLNAVVASVEHVDPQVIELVIATVEQVDPALVDRLVAAIEAGDLPVDQENPRPSGRPPQSRVPRRKR